MCVPHGEKATLLPSVLTKKQVPKSLLRRSFPQATGSPRTGKGQGPGCHASSAPDYSQSQTLSYRT